MNDPFQALREVMEAMTPEHRQNLINAHREWTRLRSFCEARGQIEIMKRLSGIRVLKRTPEVRELKKVIDFLQPANFQWEDTTTIGKKRKKHLAES